MRRVEVFGLRVDPGFGTRSESLPSILTPRDKNRKMAPLLSVFNLTKNRILILFVFGTIGAQGSCNMSPESPFFAKFSMQDLVTANKSRTGIACDPAGGGGGGGGIGSRTGGLGTGGMHFQS